MKSILTGFLLGVLSLFCSVDSFSQSNVSNKTSVSRFKHNSKVETAYDKEKDQTTVYLRPMTVRYKRSSLEAKIINEGKTDYLPAEVLSMTAYFVSPGRVLLKPQFVVVAFKSLALNKTKYAADRSLTLTLDGLPMSLGAMTIMERRVDDNMQMGPPNQYMSESLELPMPYESFLKITGAKKVKANLAGEEFQLKDQHLEAFRDLVSRIKEN